ncbi:hypothetical protein TL16_g06271 [Triparma laevis f. inornata]|uniref:Uncharacterized protein n=1 Tax=Triparma laevis f. inornata TaxID=1714386 RepID=A0A9W7ECE2_9STRA|nr:hypothetical protein TL16_g06271 [Triparma laevis f. inornata]
MAKTDTKSLPSPTKKRGRPKKEMTGSKEEVAAAKRARETMLLTGNSEISRLSDYYRNEKLEPGYWYVDNAFEYREETLTIWCSSDFLHNPSFSNEIIRKVRRMKTISKNPAKTNQTKKMDKFREKMADLLKKVGGAVNSNVVEKQKESRPTKPPKKLR